MSEQLDSLRNSLKAIAEYEGRQERSVRQMRDKLPGLRGHVERWNREAALAGVTEPCPVLGTVEKYATAAGQPFEKAAMLPRLTDNGAGAGKPNRSKPGRGKPAKNAPGAGRPRDAKPDPSPQNGGGSGSSATDSPSPSEKGPGDEADGGADDPLLAAPKGVKWLEPQARIVRVEAAEVKTHAADPDEYLGAKSGFLDRNLPKLEQFIEAKAKPPLWKKLFKKQTGDSPLFAYCGMYLADLGEFDRAAALLERGIALRQPSPIKRDLHQLHADTLKCKLEALCDAIAVTGKKGADYDSALALRETLMKSPFRGNHWKADVCKTFGTLALALGEAKTAKDNFLQIKFLDPNLGVETLLAKANDLLGETETPA